MSNPKDVRASLLIAKRIVKAAGGRVGFATGGAPDPLLGRPEGIDSEFESVTDKDFKAPRVKNDVGLYSKAAEIVRALPQQKGDVNQLVSAIKNKGVKPHEIENAGFPDVSGSISKESLAKHFERNVPDLKVVRLENSEDTVIPPRLTEEEYDRFAYLSDRNAYGRQHAGGPLNAEESVEYNRLLAIDDAYFQHTFVNQPGVGETRYGSYKTEGGDNYREHLLALPDNGDENYHSSHWDHPNVVAHVRMQDMPGDAKTLHVDEIQSDWGQDGREKGFESKGDRARYEELTEKLDNKFKELMDSGLSDLDTVLHPEYVAIADERAKIGSNIPKGPYVQNTQHWVDLALKHTLNEAAKGDYDKIQFATGGENSDRYSLQNHYKSIHYDPVNKMLNTISKDGIPTSYKGVKEDDLKDNIGDELAKRILEIDPEPLSKNHHIDYFGTNPMHSLEGGDLSSGGEGMKQFYDKLIPKSAMKLIQQHDPEIKPEKIKGVDGVERFGFSFTPKAKRSILKGQPAFAAGGAVKPSEEQKEAGNYKKRHIKFHGIDISIENDKGSTRSGKDASGKPWSVKMPADYGYAKRTVGADGDHVDTYVGPYPDSTSVFVIDQKDIQSGKFDEHKIMLGFNSLHDAENTYIAGFSDGKGKERIGAISRLTIDEFKHWLKHHDTTKQMKSQNLINKALSVSRQAIGGKK